MWDYTVVIQGQDYKDGQWGDERYHVADVGCSSLGEAMSFLESLTPDRAQEWERISGCNGLYNCVFAAEVAEDGTYTLEFEVVAESYWVEDRMVELSIMSWRPFNEGLSQGPELAADGGIAPLEPWAPSGEKWDEATFCWKTPDGTMVISAFPTANDGGGYSVNICEAKHGALALSDSGQYFGYESVADVVADYVGAGGRMFKLLDYGFEFESYDDLCERAADMGGVDIDVAVQRMGTHVSEGRASKQRRVAREDGNMENVPLDGGLLVNTDYLEMTIREWPQLIDEDEVLTEDQLEAVGSRIVEEAVDRGDLSEKIKDAVCGSDIWERLTDMVDDVVWDYVRERSKEVRGELGLTGATVTSQNAAHL